MINKAKSLLLGVRKIILAAYALVRSVLKTQKNVNECRRVTRRV